MTRTPNVAVTLSRVLGARTRTLALSFGPNGQLPSEFRLFVNGWNDTENGRYLFDGAAAASVMQAYRAWGVDLMIDLEHQALSSQTPPDPSARDARGWCRLELRDDGSLWAVGVTWTPDGAQRLAEKRQRYVSPAFTVDTETSRITSIVNVAIVAMPATHDTPPLVAASIGAMAMNPELVKKALDALVAGDTEACAAILKEMVAAAAGGEPSDAPAPLDEGGETETESAVDAGPPKDDKKEEEDDKPEEVAAASARLMRLTGAKSFVAAIDAVDVFRLSHLALESERQTLAVERATLESAERRKLCIELIKLGAEFPATVWADDAASKLKPRWLAMPIAELRTHAHEQLAARGGKRAPAPLPPGTTTTAAASPVDPTFGLTPQQLAICKEMKCEPETFARLKKNTAAPSGT